MNEPIQPASLGALLRAARRQAGLTLEELCTNAGLGVRTVSDLERDRVARPQRRTIEALVVTLGLDDAGRDAIWALARPRCSGGPVRELGDFLPPDSRDLFGVQAEARAMRQWFERRKRECPWPVVVSGMPGVGKTRFAVRVGRDLGDQFARRIYLDLHGTGDQPMDAAEAADHLLRRMGVPADAIPESAAERAQLFRVRMRTAATLVILDDVRDEAQVRALLPDDVGDGLVVLVSRRTLAGLEVAWRVTLTELDPHDAVELLGALVGPDRMAADAASVKEVIHMCGFLPLALRIVGNRLASRPSWTIAAMAERLRPTDERLSQLSIGDTDTRAAIASSYRQLTPEVRRMFRRLAMVRGGVVELPRACRLFGADAGQTERALEELVDAGLLGSADVAGKYVFNDLLRLYARERLVAEESPYTIQHLIG